MLTNEPKNKKPDDTSMGYPRVEIQPDGFEFFNERIRYVWDKEKEEFYFSVVDVIQVLTDSVDATAYWRKLKQRLKAEGNETVTLCHGLKLKARDGKKRFTDVATMERMLRIIQSVPSPKAEPIKLWLAQVGSERIDEMIDPEIAIDRAVEYYRQKGYPDKWITQRVRSIEARRDLTDEWQRAGVKSGSEFAVLTNVLTRAWSGMNTGQYKELKGLHKENLRDNMTNTELALNMLAEVSAAELSKVKNPEGFEESQDVTVQGGTIAGNARRELEKALGKSVISSSNANDMKLLDAE